jgi:hypothetical protein
MASPAVMPTTFAGTWLRALIFTVVPPVVGSAERY